MISDGSLPYTLSNGRGLRGGRASEGELAHEQDDKTKLWAWVRWRRALGWNELWGGVYSEGEL